MLPTGLEFRVPRKSQFGSEVLYTNADVDWGSERFFAAFADQGADFFDIGAHIGYYTSYLAPLVRHVYAFEPDMRNFTALQANLPVNATHIAAAVSSAAGFVALDVTQESGQVAGSGVEVAAVTIDDFVGGHAGVRPLLIKLDIEGHEMAALAGGERTIASFEPLILMEFMRSEHNNEAALHTWIGEHAYTAYAYLMPPRTSANDGPPPELDLEGFAAGNVVAKMLFLVPTRLQKAFL